MKSDSKYFIGNVAYTTPSGRMHMGHGLGQVTTDIAIRFSALDQGKETFFPFGMHSTGKDLVKIIEVIKKEQGLKENLERYNISDSEREEILAESRSEDQVAKLVDVYKKQYQTVLEKLGTAVNFDTFFSSHQAENHRFTQWTIKKLDERGLIVETSAFRPYCSTCDDIKAIEKDLSEVSAKGRVDWDNLRITETEITGGEFYCRLHGDTKITVKARTERAINYGNKEVQDKVVDLIRDLAVWPSKHKKDLEEIVRTRKAKPFERKGDNSIGAFSPFDKTKKVEALADSNIYMEFFPIAQMINNGLLNENNLTDEFFDYVYLKKGDIEGVLRSSSLSKERLNEAVKRVNELGHVDLSVIGFEHKDVHLPFSLFTHAAVLPEDYFFKEYLITGHITNKGEKMSKSKGNVVYLDDLLKYVESEGKIEGVSENASTDSLRFFLAYYQQLERDFDWDNDKFTSVGVAGTKRFVRGITEAAESISKGTSGEIKDRTDKWLSTILQRSITKYHTNMRERNHRVAMIVVVDEMTRALREYLQKSDNIKSDLVNDFISAQLSMIYPVMPRISRELYDRLYRNSELLLPSTNSQAIFPEEFEEERHEILGEEYLKSNLRAINAEVGKLRGRGDIKSGKIRVYLPSNYTLNIISSKQIPSLKDLDVEYKVDYNIIEPLVKPREI